MTSNHDNLTEAITKTRSWPLLIETADGPLWAVLGACEPRYARDDLLTARWRASARADAAAPRRETGEQLALWAA